MVTSQKFLKWLSPLPIFSSLLISSVSLAGTPSYNAGKYAFFMEVCGFYLKSDKLFNRFAKGDASKTQQFNFGYRDNDTQSEAGDYEHNNSYDCDEFFELTNRLLATGINLSSNSGTKQKQTSNETKITLEESADKKIEKLSQPDRRLLEREKITILARKAKKAEEKRIREAAARERKEKKEAEATRLAEIERKRKEAEAVKKKIFRAKYEDAVAVIIGNKNYTSKIHDVKFAENDADAMTRYLIDLGYRKGNIINLRNATQSQLRETFGAKGFHRGKLYHYIREDESDVTVFYSGHGVPLNNNGYLLPSDSNPNLIEVTGYPLKTLFENLSKIPARSMTVFIDACFSGETPTGPIVGAVSGLDVVIKLPTKQTYQDRMVVITAASSREVANWDEDAKHGLFTKYLLKALKGAADKNMKTGNQDGRVTLGEVKAYLKREMTYQSKRLLRIQNATVSGDLKTVLSAY